MSQPTSAPVLKDNQFLLDGEVVTVHHFKSEYGLATNEWEYQSVGKTTVQKLNPQLYTKIDEAVEAFRVERERLREERKKAEEQERIVKRTVEVETFKAKITTEVPELLKYSPQFRDPASTFGETQHICFSAFGESAKLYFDNKVYSSGSWHAYSTDRVWVVEDAEYHKTRHAKLTKAAAKVMELLDGYKLQAESIAKAKNEYEVFAQAVGFPLGQTSKSTHGHKPTYYTVNTLQVSKNFTLELNQYGNPIYVVAAAIDIHYTSNIKDFTLFGQKARNLRIDGLRIESPEQVKEFVAQMQKQMGAV